MIIIINNNNNNSIIFLLQTTPSEATLLTTSTDVPQGHPKGKYSRVVSMELLQHIYTEQEEKEEKKILSLPPPSSSPPDPPSPPSSPHTSLLLLSPFAAHDSTHSCVACSAQKQPPPPPSSPLLPQFIPLPDGRTLSLLWSFPLSKATQCVFNSSSFVLLKLPLVPSARAENRGPPTPPISPVFSISVGRESTSLLDLSHNLSDQLHVVVTLHSQMDAYVKTWPCHIVLGIPDSEASGRGKGGREGGREGDKDGKRGGREIRTVREREGGRERERGKEEIRMVRWREGGR